MRQYASRGSHLSVKIESSLRRGNKVYFRMQALKSKAAAKQMQDNLLHRWKYEWNTHLNVADDN